MIVYKKWETRTERKLGTQRVTRWDGWFLFGWLPLYVRMGSEYRD